MTWRRSSGGGDRALAAGRTWGTRLWRSGITILAGIWALHQLLLGSSGMGLPKLDVFVVGGDPHALLGDPELSDPPWGHAPWWRLLVPYISARHMLPSRPLSQPQSLLTLLSSRDAFISLW